VSESDLHNTEAQAAEWLIRLESEPTAETVAQWRAWLESDARRRVAFVRIENGWYQTNCLKKLRPLDGAVDINLLRPPARPRSLRSLAQASLAVGILAALLLSAAWLHDPLDHDYRTDLGGFQRARLPDGSTVLLNTDSEITVHYSQSARVVSLIRGEALFTVAHDPTRPFEVESSGIIVRALGTSFDVRQVDDSAVEILVAAGTVATGRDLMLVTGDDMMRDARGNSRREHLSATDMDHRLAWIHGEIWLQGTLADAVAEFNRYNSRKLVLTDSALATLRVGGSFTATDPKAFIAALERVFAIRALASGDAVIELVGPASAATAPR
jgi:transmembrane sensor